MKEEDLERLNKAISQGLLEVQYSDRRMRYRSLDEMLRIKRLMEKKTSSNKNFETIKFNYKANY